MQETPSLRPENRFKQAMAASVKNLSKITLWLLFAGVCIYNIQNQDWNNPIRLIKDDVQYYYIYTSAVVVYNDIDLNRVYNKVPGYERRELWLGHDKKTGRAYSKMSMGVALCYAPFTALSHYVLVPLLGGENDGYSPPYKLGLLISAMAFFLIGLLNLRKLLLSHFSEITTALTLVIIAFGTNITWYVSSEATMSHIYSFSLIVVYYRLLQKWLTTPTIKTTIFLGAIFGLIVLIRPTNLLFVILFFISDNFILRLKFLLRNSSKIGLMILLFLIVWSPQFAFWKYVSGHWFLYTYNKEGFFWGNPQIISSLFSYRKGWLVYTPLMTLTFLGLILLWRQNKVMLWQVFWLLVLMIYINSSWWCWWFGGSYGNRAYIDGYGIFALSIGAFIGFVQKIKPKVVCWITFILISVFISLNLFQTWQYRMGLIHYVSNTKESYWKNFLKTKTNDSYYSLLVNPDHSAGVLGIYYPASELNWGQKKQFLNNAIKNEKYFLQYYKRLALNNTSFLNGIQNNRLPVDKDSLAVIWAKDRYEKMKSHY